jgi:hypothetical protein
VFPILLTRNIPASLYRGLAHIRPNPLYNSNRYSPAELNSRQRSFHQTDFCIIFKRRIHSASFYAYVYEPVRIRRINTKEAAPLMRRIASIALSEGLRSYDKLYDYLVTREHEVLFPVCVFLYPSVAGQQAAGGCGVISTREEAS